MLYADLSDFFDNLIKPIYFNEQLDGYIVMIEKEQVSSRQMIITIWVSVVMAIIIAACIVKYFAEVFIQ